MHTNDLYCHKRHRHALRTMQLLCSNFLLEWSLPEKLILLYIIFTYMECTLSWLHCIICQLNVNPCFFTRMWLSWNSPSVFSPPCWIVFFFFHFSDYPLQLFSPVIAISNALFNRTIRPRAIEPSSARRWWF